MTQQPRQIAHVLVIESGDEDWKHSITCPYKQHPEMRRACEVWFECDCPPIDTPETSDLQPCPYSPTGTHERLDGQAWWLTDRCCAIFSESGYDVVSDVHRDLGPGIYLVTVEYADEDYVEINVLARLETTIAAG